MINVNIIRRMEFSISLENTTACTVVSSALLST
jgi:hypothetical protein